MFNIRAKWFTPVLLLFMCVQIVVGSTLAYFVDEVSVTGNIVTAGRLKAGMDWAAEMPGQESDWQDASTGTIFNDRLWEPGFTSVRYIRVRNEGTLAFQYELNLVPDYVVAGGANLLDVIDVYFGVMGDEPITRDNYTQLPKVGVLSDLLKNENGAGFGIMLPEKGAKDAALPSGVTAYTGSEEFVLVLHMQETAGNEYMNASVGDGFSLQLVATQYTYEKDAFGNDYDTDAELPDVFVPTHLIMNVTPDENGLVPQDVEFVDGEGRVTAVVPMGAKMADGATQLRLIIETKDHSDANVRLTADEVLTPYEVRIEGLAKDNTVPARITMAKSMPAGLNIGNYTLYHVENGASNKMTRVDAVDASSAHNAFAYDPATGDVTVAMATFSEVAVVAEPAAWEGKFDYSWYTNAVAPVDGESNTEYIIANGDQLAAFGAIVGGMKKDESGNVIQDSFKDKTVKLISDINLGDDEAKNVESKIFYPIGYNSDDGKYEKTGVAVTTGFYNFCGTFDGNGHTIYNFYQNTWEMKGDNNYYDASLQYYRDGMGLFGKVYGGTIKNLTVNNFKSDGEYTTTGVIAAYADGATFENIAITDCNPRVYNIGNGGIVGCVGWYAKEAGLKTTFKNITVDNSNKISALWGSYDVACGGIVGQYYPTSGQTSAGSPKNAGIDFVNCHVSAQMDVYNDVCGNYQYYAYRYAGMIIGSIRENVTIDGRSYPKMDGITAKNCTVNYGDWNDYYYCEFVKNGHPSYSGPDDYKFSRVPDSELTTDENGKVTCTHKHSDVEDNRAIYLPFSQLFTGYGWGVTSKGLTDFDGIKVDIKQGEQEESVPKFESTITELANNTAIKLGDIFTRINEGVKLVPSALTVTVTDLDDTDGIVTGKFERDENNWENGTITLSETGRIQITIQDYYFCTPTTIEVNVTDRQAEEKFDVVMNNGDFLHRVGNSGTVALDKLFNAKEGVTVGTVSVTVEAVNGTGASGTYSNNAIQFNGTGVVKVTITDNDYCTPTELLLEVVDAENCIVAPSNSENTEKSFVLLCNVSTSSHKNYWNCTVYGNGFTYSLKGAPTAYNSKQGHGILITKNATLDNLVIEGDVYNSYGAYTNQDYYNTAVDVVGDTTIQNCYISGCAAPVRARNGDVTIKNSMLYGGTVANLIVDAHTVTLEDVITANFDDGRSLIGMGIVIHSDANDTAKLVLNGTLTQYNFISESKVPSDTYAKNLHNAMFSSACSQYHFGTSSNRYVNTGIVSMAENFDGTDITDNAKTGYVGQSISLSSNDGYVYTQLNTSGSVNNNCPEYNPTTQGAVPPSYSFDYTNKNYVAKTEGSNDHCYYDENGKVSISMDDGDTFNWDTSILTIGKGITNYTVSMNGTDYTGKSISFNTDGDYTVTYTYTDDNNYKLDDNGEITTYSVIYTKTVNITVAVEKITTRHAEFTFGSSNTASKTVTVGNSTYVMPNVTGTSSTVGSKTVDGQTIYYPIVEIIMSDGKTSHTTGWYAYFPVFSGAVTITDYANNGTGDKMAPYNGSTTTKPDRLSVVTTGKVGELFKYQSKTAPGNDPVVKNNILVYSSAKIEANRDEYNTVVQYSYTDNAGATFYYYIGYHAPSQSYSNGCVTPDTLVTLADGTKKEIQYVNYEDQLLVWDFFKAEYAAVPSAIIFNHGEDDFDIVYLTFEDGTQVKVIAEHRFLDAATNEFVAIDATNCQDYVGHAFYKRDGENVTTVKLVSAEVKKEHSVAYSLISALHYNFFVEDMFSSPFLSKDVGAFEYFDIAKDELKYINVEEDIAQYGVYTYEDFADMITEEQFNAFNAQYMKIAVEKGDFTWEEIQRMISEYLQ